MLDLNDKWLPSLHLPLKPLRFLAIVLLIIGIFFRFVNIDRKLYWCDEAYTSLRISGYLQQEMDRQLRDGRLVSIGDLQKYQYPNLEKTPIDTVKGLIAEESQLSPLYFVLARWWVGIFGNSVAITRSLSAFISLLSLPAIYWLCRELFASTAIGMMAVALFAVSPVQVVYAQEARPYSLAILATLLSGAALLRAIRLQTKMSWIIYGSTLTLGLYTQLFFGFVIIAQSIYMLLIERLCLTRKLCTYIATVIISCLTFAPWAWIFITHPTPGNLVWVNTKQTFLDSAIRWIGIISRTAIDFGVGPSDTLAIKVAVMPLILLVFAVIIYAIYYLWQRTPKQIWLFVIVLIASICVPLMCLDFGLGKRYGTTRYILPSLLGIQLAIAYLFSHKLAFRSNNRWRQKVWAGIFGGLITIEIISCCISSQSQMWWNKLPEVYKEYPIVANAIDRTERALVITDADINDLQVLGHLVDRQTKFQILRPQQTPLINVGFSEIFLFSPSASLKAAIQKVYKSPIVKVNDLLWQVTKAT